MADEYIVTAVLIVAAHAYLCCGLKEAFNHNIQLNKKNFGQLKLESRGHFADIIHLDTAEGIKRLLCRRDKILIAFQKFATVPEWRPGQIVLGGSKWECSLSKEAGGQHKGIYGKIQDVYRPRDDRLDLVIGPIGPFDLLDEASIHFRYDPLASGSPNHDPRVTGRRQKLRANQPVFGGGPETNRFKRGTSNMLTDILNQIDWHKNVSMFVPFNYDARRHRQTFQFSLKQNNGSDPIHVTTGTMGIKDLLTVPDYFSLDCFSCFSVASIKYTLDLKIEKVNNKPVVKQYISQVESNVEMHTDFALRFRKEMSLNASTLFWRTQPKELLRIPIAAVPGLPPVELLVSYDMDIYADVHAAVNGPTVLRNKYITKGSYVMSQTLSSKTNIFGDVSVYNWTVKPLESHSMLPSFADVKTSFKHRMGFNASLLWSGKDVSIMMSPQTDITVKPDVNNYVNSDYFGKCLRSTVMIGGSFAIQDAYFDVQAFGKEIWNAHLASGYKNNLSMTSGELNYECKARCVGPVVIGYPNEIETVLETSHLNLSRNHSQFAKHFRDLREGSIIFRVAENDYNCDGCRNCNESTEDITKVCSARLVTKSMATTLARLQQFARTEWPDRHLEVIQGFDESPDFKYNISSPFRDGRAMILGLSDVTSSMNASPSLSNNLNKIRRLGQLAVCSGFDYVALKNMSGQLAVEVGVVNETEDHLSPSATNTLSERNIFQKAIQSAGSKSISCSAKVQYRTGDSYPSGQTVESRCGPSPGRLHFLSPSINESLYEYPFNDINFRPEGRSQDWCGSELRRCNSCNQSSLAGSVVSWDSCITRLMTPRLALRLRKLANIAKQYSLELQVEKALVVDGSDGSPDVQDPLFFEGRAARIRVVMPDSQTLTNTLMNAAVCAGFDFVRYTSSDFVDVFLRRQNGFVERKIYYPSGRGFVSVQSPENLTSEYSYPAELATEARHPALIDGHDDSLHLSKYYAISDFKDKIDRDFRLDPSLVECLEEASEELGRKVKVVPLSAYKTRSSNIRNQDFLHPEETLRHQAGQAARVNLGKTSSNKDLIKLGKSLMRKCLPLLQQQQRSIGIGCHTGSLYVDIRPVMAGEETSLMHVWNSGGDEVFKELHDAAETVNKGGPLIAPMHRPIACSAVTMVSSDKPYLSFQLGYPPQCTRSGSSVSDFCQKTKQHLLDQASKLQDRLTSAAGADRLPRRDILNEINACVVDECGGCPGTGPIWDRKVRACSKMIGKYLSRASNPFREMANKTSFFNPDNDQSSVHSLACHDGNICVENTQLYSLLMPLITAKYRVNPENSVEERLFNNEDNPSPLLELVGQELAMQTSGIVKVYIDTLGDISRIRNVLKVAMVFNKKVSNVEFHISGNINKDSVMATIQRKIEIWSGTVCSDVSRLTIAPFSVHTIHEHRLKRSAERSQARNQAKLEIRNWEMEWLSKL